MKLLLFFLLFSINLQAKTLTIAVASNFAHTLKKITKLFEQKQDRDNKIKIKLIVGSTGKHFAQIKNGAPYDLFFAADSLRPKKLEDLKLIQKDSRFTYAIGKLALWKKLKKTSLKNSNFRFLAIANPKLAPYGKAAIEYLKNSKQMSFTKNKIIYGQNIGQALQYVKTGDAQFALVSYTQARNLELGYIEKIPRKYYSNITQQAVLIKNSKQASIFLKFFNTQNINNLIEEEGYELPSKLL